MKKFSHIAFWTTMFSVLSLSSLIGCAHHNIPSADYSSPKTPIIIQNQKRVTVAFDQEGSLYPETTQLIDWNSPGQSSWDAFRGVAFNLNGYADKDGKVYTATTNDSLIEYFSTKISGELKEGSRLIVLIHGFNVDNTEIDKMYSEIEKTISTADDDVVLRVIWDGMLKAQKSEGQDIAYWPEAIRSSNMAGQFGLRSILNRIDKDFKLRFVTHSRGAAVALASLYDPIVEAGANELKFGVAPEFFHANHVIDIKMASFKPAVDNALLYENNLPIEMVVALSGMPIEEKLEETSEASGSGTTNALSKEEAYFMERREKLSNIDLKYVTSEDLLSAENLSFRSESGVPQCVFSEVDLYAVPQTCDLK